MNDTPYKASGIHNYDGQVHYIEGPNMPGYYGAKPTAKEIPYRGGFITFEEAKMVAHYMNIAFQQGINEQNKRIKNLIGL